MARTMPIEHVRQIVDAVDICATKAANWKARALAAEEALSKFAAEVYGRRETDKRLGDELRQANRGCSGYEPSLSVLQRAADDVADYLSPAPAAQGIVSREGGDSSEAPVSEAN